MGQPSLSWSWSDFLRSALCTLPAALVVLIGDPSKGLAWAMGSLPAATLGLAATRRQRSRVVVVGALFALSVSLGSILAQTKVTTIAGIFFVALGTALLASRRPFGLVAINLCAPVAAIGLSYSDIASGVGLGVIMLGGSIFSYLVYLLWPERPSTESAVPTPELLPRAFAWRYGILFGLAGAASAAVGVAVQTDHVGWAAGSSLLVMRPSKDMQKLRSVGRLLSVLVGAFAAVLFVRAAPDTAVISIVAVGTLAAAGATHRSRWYVTPLFTTFMALTMILYSNATTATEEWRFKERVIETTIGVGFAYFFGLFIPRILARLGRSEWSLGIETRP